MGNDKSILEKIADTVKDIANIAAEAADHALKDDKPPGKADEKSGAAYIPLAAEGFVSGPFMVPPIAVAPIRGRRHLAAKPAAKKASRRTAKTANKSSGRAAKKSVAKRSSKTARNSARKASSRVGKTRSK